MKRIVIKVGSALLSDGENLALERVQNLATFIAEIRKRYEVILVSSGAIVIGYFTSKLEKNSLANRQALAAIGQPLLMNIYRDVFTPFNITPAQLLLCAEDFDSRQKTQNAKNSIQVLLRNQFLPIINENDATGIQEILFGDNDRLSAHITHYFDADLLVILSDIYGYFDKDPHKYQDAKLRKTIQNLTQQELNEDLSPHMKFATGGIVTKLQAADFLMKKGRKMFLTSGFDLNSAYDFLMHNKHTQGTLFG
ncbi:glutamate 5-kinase [Helicobacter monodelphidis]|uniref:glutamate 5-kinase n=1 Tax=Helicobacter sp. 15-1451 TaxID=2004995 RepID=UPI000DCCD29D|nr:glutamate 5-kinase [Helicobacter sp. 15-1451]RAX57898.1 glutamate 5-kinase [Helicobacter sp. 15-1451]